MVLLFAKHFYRLLTKLHPKLFHLLISVKLSVFYFAIMGTATRNNKFNEKTPGHARNRRPTLNFNETKELITREFICITVCAENAIRRSS